MTFATCPGCGKSVRAQQFQGLIAVPQEFCPHRHLSTVPQQCLPGFDFSRLSASGKVPDRMWFPLQTALCLQLAQKRRAAPKFASAAFVDAALPGAWAGSQLVRAAEDAVLPGKGPARSPAELLEVPSSLSRMISSVIPNAAWRL